MSSLLLTRRGSLRVATTVPTILARIMGQQLLGYGRQL
jgi:hypothetical protein